MDKKNVPILKKENFFIFIIYLEDYLKQFFSRNLFQTADVGGWEWDVGGKTGRSSGLKAGRPFVIRLPVINCVSWKWGAAG
ncbi:MAG TPA: hypothetical protein PLY40_06500 [Bacillota bacterium]|nr:hypothetical protein [Bacillota bacterium]